MKFVSSYIYMQSKCTFTQMQDPHHITQSNQLSILECTLSSTQGQFLTLPQKKFAKALASQQFNQLSELTLKIHHDLFDSQDIQPVIDAINGLPRLKKLRIIIDPLFTVNEKNWTCHIDKHILVQIVEK